jgi:hypothetical protein
MFSKTWKPKKTREISGPVITAGFSPNKISLLLIIMEHSDWDCFIFIMLAEQIIHPKEAKTTQS